MLEKLTVFWEVVFIGFKSILSNKLRSFLTMLGILIGVTTIITMVAVIEGINESFQENLQSMGSATIFVSKTEPGIHMGRMPAWLRNRKNLTVEDSEAIDSLPLIKGSTPYLGVFTEQFPLKYRGETVMNARIAGVGYKLPMIQNLEIEKGRFFNQGEQNAAGRVCILGGKIVEEFFPNAEPLGKQVTIGGRPFLIVGVMPKKDSSGMFGGDESNEIVYIPYTTALHNFVRRPRWLEIMATPIKPVLQSQAMDQVIELLRIRRKVKPSEDNNFAVFTQDTISDLYNQLTGAVFFVMILISGISLLVGGIGVMNIMIVTVKERTREIGLRKAIGANRKDILFQFLIEAVTLTFTGGGVGILIGWILSIIIKKAANFPASITLWSILLGLGMATLTGLFFGIFPALKAAKMPPVEALRYE